MSDLSVESDVPVSVTGTTPELSLAKSKFMVLPTTSVGLLFVPVTTGQLAFHAAEPTSTHTPLEFLNHIRFTFVTATTA